jgi:hypothetical protein
MYIVVEKESQNSAIIKENKALSEYLGCSVGTITNKKHLTMWEWGKYTVYKPSYIQIKSSRGGKRAKKGEFY